MSGKISRKYPTSFWLRCFHQEIHNKRKSFFNSNNFQVFDFALDDEDLALLSTLNDPTKKVLKLENLQEKFSLPDGYKLNGQIFDVPHSENFWD